MKKLLKQIHPIFGVMALELAVLGAGAAGMKALDESRGYVYIGKGPFDWRDAYKSEGSEVYDQVRVGFVATNRGGFGYFSRPITAEERKELADRE